MQVALVVVRVAATLASSSLTVWLPTSVTFAFALQTITSLEGMVDLSVIVILNTKVPVVGAVAGRMFASTCGVTCLNSPVTGST